MAEKDVWKWLIPKLEHEMIYIIYSKGNIVCPGFRANNISAVKSNRKRLDNYLTLKAAEPKMRVWFKSITLEDLGKENYGEKEINQLLEDAEKHGAANILTKLVQDEQDKKANQLFAKMKEEASHLLDISTLTITEEGMFTEKNKETEPKKNEKQEPSEKKSSEQSDEEEKNDDKIVRKLEQKIENMTAEMNKLKENTKVKLDLEEKKTQEAIAKFNELNGKHAELGQERAMYEKKSKEFERKVETLQREVNMLKEQKEEWEAEKKRLEEIINDLTQSLDEIRQKEQLITEEEANMDTWAEVAATSTEERINILVIGKPAQTTHFLRNHLDFTFVDGSEITEELAKPNFDEIWVLLYELSLRDKINLQANDDYKNFPTEHVKVCKNFDDVRDQLHLQELMEMERKSYVRSN
ncbi:hypothetical protein CN918_25435 [Priestia megaterium]|nr:hypothetical protein CN918_25435 [Priestia megaterium]